MPNGETQGCRGMLGVSVFLDEETKPCLKLPWLSIEACFANLAWKCPIEVVRRSLLQQAKLAQRGGGTAQPLMAAR